jgi:RNA polymerase sigma factor (sigma-70 family)
MKNTPCENYKGPRLPPEIQLQRVQHVIQEELTPLQRETLFAYYFHEMSVTAIAKERGVNKSTVWRTLRLAESRLKRYLKY